jgi:hypothetical protein
MGQPTNYLLGGQAGLLGADPELYRQQLLQQEQARVAAMPAQNQLAGTLGGLLGRGVSNVAQDRGFFEVTNPVLQKLTSIQSVYNRAMQDSDPNVPMSFYKNLQTGFAEAGLGQQALMATQELRKVEEQGLKTEAAKTDLYKKNPALLDTQIAKARDLGDDKLANQLAQQRGQIQVQVDLDRQKELAQLGLLGAQTEAQRALAKKYATEIPARAHLCCCWRTSVRGTTPMNTYERTTIIATVIAIACADEYSRKSATARSAAAVNSQIFLTKRSTFN